MVGSDAEGCDTFGLILKCDKKKVVLPSVVLILLLLVHFFFIDVQGAAL